MGDNFSNLAENVLSELQQVFHRMDSDTVKPLIDQIQKAKSIFLIGAGREGLATRAFAMRLMHLGYCVHWIWDDTTPSIGTGDLLIYPCGCADLGHINHVVKSAKQAGATTVMLTPVKEGYLFSVSDYVIHVPAEAFKATGDYVKTTQLMGNLFEQTLFVLYDVVIMMIKDKIGMTNEDLVARHRNVE